MIFNQPCWITIENGLHLKCQLIAISETNARILVPAAVSLPPTVELYLREDGKVGRSRRLKKRSGDYADLDIVGRVAAAGSSLNTAFEL